MSSSSERSEECNRLMFEAVNESSVSKLKLVITSYSEREILASLSQCNENGENPLVIALKGENAGLTDLLICFLRCCIDSCHPVPLDLFDKLSHQIPVVQLIEHLFVEFCDIAWLKFLGQVFIESISFTQQDKIIALELIGALLNMEYLFTFLYGYPIPVYPCDFGLQCWREAMKLRYFPAKDEPLLPKIPFVPIPSVASSVVFGSAVEVLNMEELDLLEEHLKRDYYRDERLTSKQQMQRQALLVIRRVTSQSNSEHPHRLYLESLLKFVTDLVVDVVDNPRNLGYSGGNQLITNTFLLILEQIKGFDPKKITGKSFKVIFSTFHYMSLYFFKMIRQPSDSPGSKEPTYANLLVPTDMIANVFPEPAMMMSSLFEYGFDMKRYDLAEVVFCFVFVFESISSRLSSQEKQHLEDCYSNYIRIFFPERTATVLHAAVRRQSLFSSFFWELFRVTTIENLKTMIKYLIKLGADPNAIDWL